VEVKELDDKAELEHRIRLQVRQRGERGREGQTQKDRHSQR
jgi:hypothetical protein